MLSEREFADLCIFYPDVRGVSEARQAELKRAARVARAPAGSRLYGVGDPCEAFVFVLGGRLRAVRRNGAGRTLTLYEVRPGSVCSLSILCLFSGSPAPAEAIVVDDLTAVAVPRDAFVSLADEPAFRSFLFTAAAQRQRAMLDLLADAVFHTVERRLGRLLLSEEQPLRATHQQLAEHLGTAREVVSRTLKDLESRSVLRLQRGAITLVDPGALRTMISSA